MSDYGSGSLATLIVDKIMTDRQAKLTKEQIDAEVERIYQQIKRQVEFEKYYKTSEWRSKFNQAMKRDNYRCQVCGGNAEVVHHLTYAHFKHEPLSDLISVCKRCHHDRYHPDKPRDEYYG